MPISVRRVLVVLVSLSSVLLSVGLQALPVAAADDPVVTGVPCTGSTDTLSWAQQSVAGLTGYHIVQQHDVAPFEHATFDLPPDQTSLQFVVPFNRTVFSLYAVTSAGVATAPFGVVAATGYLVPYFMHWGTIGPNVSGDGLATVTFFWTAPSLFFFSGGDPNVSVTVTATPGGASITSLTSREIDGGLGVTDTFTGLTNGVTYTFVAVATNQCGSSGPTSSPGFTPRGSEPTTTTSTTSTTTTPATTCIVSGFIPGPPKQQQVTVQSGAGLVSISNIHVTNGTVSVAPFTHGTTGPVVVTATKTDPTKPTPWHFVAKDRNGDKQTCG